MIRRILMGAVVGLGALCAGPAAVLAHPAFLQAAPAPGLVAPKAPPTVAIVLTEPIVPQGSRVSITGPRGKAVPASAPKTADGKKLISVKPHKALRPAVYRVRWTVLGQDGHVVSGDYSFGVPEADGAPPPGAETLTASGGRGDENATAEGAIGVIARWLGIVAASFLFAGGLLVGALRRRGPRDAPDGAASIFDLAPLVWLLAIVAASQGIIAGATAGVGDEFDVGLLTGSATGRAELARAAVVIAVTIAVLASGERPRRREVSYTAGGAALLLTYALSGHVLADPTAFALIDQAVHVLAAGLWLGGVIALVVVTRRGGVDLLRAARAFGPIAGGALVVAIVTGMLAAIREVDRWYFLRWSDYGRVVIAKAILVLLVAVAGGYAAWRSRRPSDPGPRPRLLGAEALGVLAIVVLAATLAGLAQGRNQPLPAQRGLLFAGPALETAVLPTGGAEVGLAPARKGRNTVSVSFPGAKRMPRSVALRLTTPNRPRAIVTPLRRAPGATAWSADVGVPQNGTWYGYVTVDGRRSAPVQLRVGVPSAPGAEPIEVLATADLTGPGATRCRDHIQGLQLALARINAEGGLDGGRKVASLVLDDGGSPARSRARARAAIDAAHPIALAGVCGDGGEGAIAAASAAGVPSIVGDPSVGPSTHERVFRLAVDPYAEGLAWAESLGPVLGQLGVGSSHTVAVIAGRDAQGERRLAGLRAGTDQLPGVKLAVLAPGALADPARRAKLLDRRNTLTLFVDGPAAGGRDAAALRSLGPAGPLHATPPPVVLSGRVLSEQLVIDAGAIGRIGVLQGASEVSTKTRDGLLYGQAVPLLYPGDRASLEGLRGYATGLALKDGLRDGIGAGQIAGALTKPNVFTDALLAPWSPRDPGAGSPNVVSLAPQFISPTLTPASQGGDKFNGAYFPDGAWLQTSHAALGLTKTLRAPPLP